ncbi:DUF4303 domain-containing protein [uncultured Cocleimonas sp.]|uniref:DUF4303 domain-containing protein n=1 Tax=uncultured Cocleimonas sp. TaxID=1051587 RepID=UPI00262F4E4B|nr:DUF4303 domain-containing protein [uncultured Cocleimonas sp.]
MTIEELANLISKAAKVAFTEAHERYGEDQLIGYSIISHDTADSCFPVVATKNGCANYEYGSDSYFLFTQVEWDGSCDNSVFYKVNEEIGKLYDLGDYEQDPDWHNKFREFVFESNVRGLELLIDEGFFGTEEERNKLFIAFSVSDSETSETHLPNWVKRLNTESVNAKYSSSSNV